jgi:UDP-N-acetylglucosamine acyltransferase
VSAPAGTVDIHPSSVVDPHAQVAPGVRVGPFSWVGPDVVLDEGVVLDSHVRVEGRTRLGANVHVHAGAVLGGPPQDLKFRPGTPSGLEVGEGTVVRECATANVGTDEGSLTRIGSGCLIMAYAHIAHNVQVGDRVILANGVQLAGYVTVEDHAILGGLVPVHQFVRVGCHAMVGGGFRVPQDVAPYIRAGGTSLKPMGLNLVGLRRRGFSEETIAALRSAYRILFREGLGVDEAVARIRSEVPSLPEVRHFAEFALSSERGLAR